MSDNPQGYDETLNRVYRFLSIRPRTEHEMEQYLQKRHTKTEIGDKIMAFLRSQNLINDTEFAAWWIEQRTKFRPKGQGIIKMELKQKGIPDTILDAISINPQDQKDMIKKLIQKQMPKYTHLPKYELYQKLGAYLSRRGFNWESIKRGIDEVLEEGV
jgi:regulatory protein